VLLAGFAVTLAVTAAPRADAQCPAPTVVVATDGTQCTSIRVGWNGTRLGTTWRIWRATSANGHDVAVIASTTAQFYTDTDVQLGKSYYYWIQQFGGACGLNSLPGGGDEGWTGTLAPPTGLDATDGPSCDVVHVTWDAVAHAVSYDVFRAPSSESEPATLLGNTTQTAFDDTTAEPLVKYSYSVRARGNQGCVMILPAGTQGSLNIPPLPDLVLDPTMAAIQHFNVQGAPGAPWEYQIRAGIENVGTAPLHLFHTSKRYPGGARDFYQRHFGCDNRLTASRMGTFDAETDVDSVTIPHFLRVRFRERLANNAVGDVVAQMDLAARCVRDDSLEHPELPGAPAAPAYVGCGGAIRGISIGWKLAYLENTPGHQLDLRCVGAGDYWIEQEVDPEDLIYELNETNNLIRVATTLPSPPQPSFPPCTTPTLQATLLGPDSLQFAAGAMTDTITASLWAAEYTEAPGAQALFHAEFGYAPTSAFSDPGAAGDRVLVDAFTWSPATFHLQDGPADVYRTQLVIPQPGEYLVAFRVQDFQQTLVLADLDGSLNGWNKSQARYLRIVTTTGVGDPLAAALSFRATSNPSRRSTRFRLSLPAATDVAVSIFDVRGRLVRDLESGPRVAGEHDLDWDGRDDAGRTADAGVYFARLTTGRGERLVAKWVLTP
jgi:hypothetical protein